MTSEQQSVTEATDSVFAELQLSTCQCWNDFHLFESIFPRSEGTKETKLTAMLALVTDIVRDERHNSLSSLTKSCFTLVFDNKI